MAGMKLEFLKEKLNEVGLTSDQWEDWLTNASETLWASRLVLEKFEPYARSEIRALKEVEEFLITLTEELQEVRL